MRKKIVIWFTLCGDYNLIRGFRLTSGLIKAMRVGVIQPRIIEAVQPIIICWEFVGVLAKQ